MSFEDFYSSLDDKWDSLQKDEEESVNQDVDYYRGQRGTWGDLASSAARGVRNVMDMTGSGLEQIGISNPLDEGADYLTKNWNLTKPDVDTAFGLENPLVRGLKSIPESVITSVGTAAEGAVLGGLATGGNPLGMAAGGLASLTLNFGAGIYKQKYDEYLEKNPFDYKGADEYGKSQAIPELGWEIASNALAIGTFGGSKLVTSLAKEGIEATARSLLSTSAKSLIGKSLVAGGVETGSELLTYYNQASADEKYGMGQGPNLDGFIETAAASMGMSLLFGGVGSKYTIDQQRTLLDSLQSGNKELQAKASDLVFKQIQSNGDTDLANAWSVYSKSYTDAGVPINLDDNIIEVARKVKNEGVTLQDITSDNPSVQKNAVDKILQSAGVDPITGPDVEEINELNSLNAFETRYAGEFAGDALAYNQQRNLGTKESRRQREILEGRQDLERKQAERDSVAAATPTEDPVKALERIYQENMPWETMTSLGEETYNASDTDNYKFRRDLLESKREMDALTQEDLQYREGVAAEKFGEKSLKEQKEKNKPNKQQTIKFEMDRLMKELEEDSNNLTEEAKEKVNSQVVEVAMSSARRGDMKLLNYIKKQELDRVNIGTGVLGIFLTPQERLELKKAKTTKSKAVKGSKKHREAVATVKVLERKATTTPKVEVTPAPILSSSAQSVMEETKEELKNRPITSELFTAAEEGEAVRAVGVKDEDGSLIAPHVAEIEGEEIASGKKLTDEKNLDFTSGNDTILPSKNKIEGGPVKAVDTSGNADDVINEVATKSKSPLLKAILTGSPKDIYREVKKISEEGRFVALERALKELPKEVVSLYSDVIVPRIKVANEIISPADSDGVKASDAIFWNRTEESGNYQVGYHKETDQVAKIIKKKETYHISSGKELIKVVDSIEEANKIGASLEKEGKKIKIEKKDGYYVYLDKNKVGLVGSISSARELANNKAVPLSKEGKKRTRGKNVLSKDEQEIEAARIKNILKVNPKSDTPASKEDKKGTAKPAESELESARRSLVATKEMQEKYPDQDFSKIITKWENKISELEAKASNEAFVAHSRRKAKDKTVKDNELASIEKPTTKDGKEVEEVSTRVANLLSKRVEEKRGYRWVLSQLSNEKDINYVKQKLDKHIKGVEEKFDSASTILDLIINKAKDSKSTKIDKTRALLARLIKSAVNSDKLKGIKIEGDDINSTARYDIADNKIYLVSSDDIVVAFHELIHGLTVREYLSLDKNNPLVKKINSLMRALREHSLEQGLVTQDQIDILDTISTSEEFRNNLDKLNPKDQSQLFLLYSLLNPKEFLSMAFTDDTVLSTLADIPVTGVSSKGGIRTMLDSFWKFISDLLGIARGERTALEEVIKSGIKLIKSNAYEVEFSDDVSESIFNIFKKKEVLVEDTRPDFIKSTEEYPSNNKKNKLPSGQEAGNLFENHLLSTKSVKELIKGLIPTLKDPSYRAIANRIFNYIDDKTELVIVSPDVQVDGGLPKLLQTSKGVFVVDKNKIYLRSSEFDDTAGTTEETFLHETLHTVINRRINLYNDIKYKDTPIGKAIKEYYELQDLVIKEIKRRRNEVSKEDAPYLHSDFIATATNSIDEFISYGLTNKDYQKLLSNIKVKGGTVYSKLVELVRNLLGLEPKYTSALDELIRVTDDLLEYSDINVNSEGNQTLASTTAPTTTSFVEDEIKKYKKLDDERTIKEKARDVLKSTEKLISEVFQPVYEALSNISKPLAEKVRHMDFLINRETTARTNLSSPFVRKYRMLTKEQTEEISFLLNNYDSEDAKNLLNSKLATLGKQSKTKGIDKDFKNIVTMLKEIDDQADTFGLKKFASVDFYFPRRVSNYDDLVAYLRNKNYKSKVENLIKKNEILELRGFLKKEGLLEETKTFLDDKNYTGLVAYLDNRSDWGVIDEAVKEAEDKAAKTGDVLTDSQRAEVVSNMLRVGRMPSAYLRTPAGTKKRSISSVNAEMMQFYHDPIEALGMHIREMTERIEINRMLGITKNKELNKSISDKVKEIEKADSQEKRTTLIKELIALENKIPAMTVLIDEGIGKILDEEVKKRSITSDNQKRAKELIRARITQVGTNKFFSGVRQLALLGSLTQLSTGLRNITDNVWGMFLYGSTNQISSLIDTAARTRFSWKGRKWYDPDVTVTGKNIKELGLSFDAPLREYSTMNNVVDKAIRASGLMLVDKISKIATMEAALKKFSKMSEESFDKKFSEIFGKETAQVYKDIKEKNITESVEYLLFSEIANFQPIALSETSQRFLTGGNWRIAYLLKSYSIHSASNFYRESIQKVREGIKEKDNDKIKLGFKNITLLGTLFIAIGASDDWLIDWFNGKEPDFTDSMIETLLTLAITSKYTIDRSKQDGLVGGYMETLLPPTGLFDLPFKDFMSLLEGEPTFKSIKMFPGIGTLYFNRATEEGQKNIINNHKRLLYEEYKEDFKIPSDGVRKVNKRIKEFNQRFKPEEEISTLTPGTFSSIRTKELKKK